MQKKNWEEAAQTKIMIGALVAQHLAHKGKMFTDIKAFQLISPNVLEEVPMPKMDLPVRLGRASPGGSRGERERDRESEGAPRTRERGREK